MFAGLLTEKNQIDCVQIDTPEPGPGEVRVRVSLTGICGSDVPRVLQGKVHNFPLVLGHEFSGVVDKVGPDVPASMVGQRVSGIPLIPCKEEKCPACSKGDYSLCRSYSFVGSRVFGSMAEYVCVPVSNVFPIDGSVSDLEGAFFEPATVALHGINLAKPEKGKSAIVLGCGTIGILLALALPYYGISNVVVAVHHAGKDAAVRSVGLTKVIATDIPAWKGKACDLAGVDAFDYVFDAAGTPATILDAFEVAGNHATLCFVGTPKNDVFFTSQQWELVNRKELMVTGSWMSYSAPWPGSEWEDARRLFSLGTLKITQEMIDCLYGLTEIKQAFERFAQGNVKGKILIDSRR